MPPNPCATRWNSWFFAVQYHREYFGLYKEFIEMETQVCDRSVPQSVERLQDMLQDPNLAQSLNVQINIMADKCKHILNLLDIFESRRPEFDLPRRTKTEILRTVGEAYVNAEEKLTKYMSDGQPAIEFLQEPWVQQHSELHCLAWWIWMCSGMAYRRDFLYCLPWPTDTKMLSLTQLMLNEAIASTSWCCPAEGDQLPTKTSKPWSSYAITNGSSVNPSQALNSKPTSPWIVVQEDGTVVMALCTCMAGLGEVCSHAAALMFIVLAAVERRENQTCTEKPCTWTQPSTKMVKYDEVSNIFAIKEQVQTMVQTEDLFQHMRPSADDFKLFCEQLHQSEEQETKPKKSAILSVIEGHSHRYTPKTVQLDLPTPLTSLYQSSRLVLDLPALLEEGAKVFDELNLTPEQHLKSPLLLCFQARCLSNQPVAGVWTPEGLLGPLR
ncbi:hypothetical protein JOQ06_029300 [Pogonophryne albipinna]|uniref:SWIM-type domain-containing protein n=1 Tax=Pogonophryne albipinna TaxID=1090488 RepID=A0AAD6BBR4_9TELE|nr:hypothetical protein JOQ06_029300 [Pogonophryne albipinna]